MGIKVILLKITTKTKTEQWIQPPAETPAMIYTACNKHNVIIIYRNRSLEKILYLAFDLGSLG